MIGFIGTSLELESMTVYDSLHSSLDHERLLFHCDDWRTTNHISHAELSYEWLNDWIEFTNELSFITSGGLNSGHHLEQLIHFVIICVFSVAPKRSNKLLSNGGPTVDCLTSWMCLPKRCLAMDYSGFQASYHNIINESCVSPWDVQFI
jgi:hypothetical protein